MNQKHIYLIIAITSLSLIAGIATALKMENLDYIEFNPKAEPFGCTGKKGTVYYDDTENLPKFCTDAASWSYFGTGGTGTSNYIPKWSGTNQLTDSIIYQEGIDYVAVGTILEADLDSRLHIRDGQTWGTDLSLDASGVIDGRRWLLISTGGTAGEGTGKFLIKDNTAGAGVRLTIDTTGNVGIGTGPEAKLDVNGQLYVHEGSVGGLTLEGRNAWSSRLFANAYYNGSSEVYRTTGRGAFKIDVYHDGDTSSQYIAFYGANQGTADNTITWNTVGLAMDEDGNIGIGTTNPASKFVVDNTDNLTYQSLLSFGNGVLTLKEDSNQHLPYIEWVGNDDKRAMYFGWGRADTTPPYIQMTLENDYVLGITGGNVGIGTTNPEDKLVIAGNLGLFGAQTSIVADKLYPVIYRADGSGTFPFNTAGGLVLQSRDRPAAGIALATGEGPTVKMSILGDGNILIAEGYVEFPTVDYRGGSYGPITQTILRLPAYTDGANIISRQLSSDIHEILLQMYDNNTGDAFKIWFDDYRGDSYDRYPLEVRGDRVLLVQDNGSVGIGTTDPGATLEISSTQDGILRLRQDEAGTPWNYIEFYNDSTRQWYLGQDSDGKFRISDKLVIKTDGSVGIGTTNPSNHMLDVASVRGGAGNSAIRALYPGGGGLTGTEFGALAHRNSQWNAVYAKAGNAGAALYTDGEVNMMNGNVGIGTTNPGAKLEVNGNLTYSGNLKTNLGPRQWQDTSYRVGANTQKEVSYSLGEGVYIVTCNIYLWGGDETQNARLGCGTIGQIPFSSEMSMKNWGGGRRVRLMAFVVIEPGDTARVGMIINNMDSQGQDYLIYLDVQQI